MIDRYIAEKERSKFNGHPIDPKLESAYFEIMKDRDGKEERLRSLIERYNIEVERAIKHGGPVPISVEQAYIELMNPELGKTTKQTKSKLFPSTANWPKWESPKKAAQSRKEKNEKIQEVAEVKTQEPESKPSVRADDPCPRCAERAHQEKLQSESKPKPADQETQQ